jgi:hypothetical protein
MYYVFSTELMYFTDILHKNKKICQLISGESLTRLERNPVLDFIVQMFRSFGGQCPQNIFRQKTRRAV